MAVNISHYEQLLEGVCRLCGGSNHKLAKKIIAELGILLSEQIDNNLNTVLIGTLEYFLSRNIRIREVYELIAN